MQETRYKLQKSVEELREEALSKEVDLQPLFTSIQELRKAAEKIDTEKKVRLRSSMTLELWHGTVEYLLVRLQRSNFAGDRREQRIDDSEEGV